MDGYVFPGFPEYLRRAADCLGCDTTAAGGPPPASLAVIAGLCAQASIAHADHVAVILAGAEVRCDRLRVATRAAELMIDEVRAARASSGEEQPARTSEDRPKSRTTKTRH